MTNPFDSEHPLAHPSPYIRLPSPIDINTPVIRKHPILTKKLFLFATLIGSSITILLIISIRLVLSMKSSTIHDTTTTILNHSPIPTITSLPIPCSIPAVNAMWNNSAIVFINRFGQCLSNESGLCNPGDLFIDDIHDTLYIADTNNNRIQKYSLTEIYDTEVGAIGITVASKHLILPQSIFVDIHTENMYILDLDQEQKQESANQVSYRVHLWKKNEKVGRILFSEALKSSYGRDFHHLTLDKQMNIYVGTRYFIKKWLVSTDYMERVIIAGTEQHDPRQSIDPGAFVITDDLTLYTADRSHSRIAKWTVNATQGTTIIEKISYVSGLTIDCNGYIYFVGTYNYTIYQLNLVGLQPRKIVGLENLSINYIFNWSAVIQFDKFGNLFLIGSNQVYKFSIV